MELRNSIYDFLTADLVSSALIFDRTALRTPWYGLARTNRQLSREYLPLLRARVGQCGRICARIVDYGFDGLYTLLLYRGLPGGRGVPRVLEVELVFEKPEFAAATDELFRWVYGCGFMGVGRGGR
ncbi:hypothetical protein LTR08_004510 [Meristemomyces frigidus]|nr:hypothetical protein LTR08_004510 [Meristemomyces frigidus]